MARKTNDKFIKDEFKFFRERARTGEPFTISDLRASSDRQLNDDSWKTYWDKKWKQFVEVLGDGKFRVRTDFLRLDPDDFASVYRQAETLFAEYQYCIYPSVLVFEFFLPLTHERKLRSSLDAIFYRDDLQARLTEIGADRLSSILGHEVKNHGNSLIDEALELITTNFGGYSISHVDGRFRASNAIRTRADAAKLLAIGRSYIIDETTAIVRFIFPIGKRTIVNPHECDMNTDNLVTESPELAKTANQIRNLLIQIFVQALAHTVRYEDEIWLLETGLSCRLWKLTAQKKDEMGDTDDLYEDE